MYKFIIHSLKQMSGGTYLCLLFLYTLLCWLMCDIIYKQKGSISSGEIIDTYNLIIFSLVFLNSIFFIISHYRETLNSKIRDILITRLGRGKFFWGLLFCYFIYLVGCFILPMYIAAFIQQVIINPSDINFSVYINSFIISAIKTGAWPFVLSVLLITWLKNDLLTLVIWSVFYFLISAVFVFSGMYTAADGNAAIATLPVILSIVLNASAIAFGLRTCKLLTEYEYNEKISNGIFSAIAGALKLELSEFHFKMLGLKTQNLILIFGSLGFALTLKLLSGMDANYMVVAKIYTAVFFPLLFSFNQYNLIAVDIESGMIATNLLRKTEYRKIILNRWITMLAPQIVFSFFYSVILFNIIYEMNLLFMLLVIFFNLLFGAVNFFLSVYFNKPGNANFIIGFIAYLMLREDVQNIFASNKILNSLNIFECVTSFSIHSPMIIHVVFAALLSAVFILLTYNRLKRIEVFS